AARVSRTREHRVFCGDPALVLAAKERRHPFLDTGGDEHARVAKPDEDRTLSVAGETWFGGDSAHFVGRASGWAHGDLDFFSCQELRLASRGSRCHRQIPALEFGTGCDGKGPYALDRHSCRHFTGGLRNDCRLECRTAPPGYFRDDALLR